jgi:serine/threonine-protein kinase
MEMLRRGAGADGDNPVFVRGLRTAIDSGASPAPTPLSKTPPAGATGSGPRASQLTAEELDRVTQALVGAVGPIARVLVKKAAAGARDFHDLCMRVGEHLANDAERAEFLRKVNSR